MSVQQTTEVSITIQKISLFLNFIGLSVSLPEKHLIIQDLLLIEILVQIIELAFYLIFLEKLSTTVTGMAKTRYYDWFITTPSMLLTIIIYFEYLSTIESNGTPFRFLDFVQKHQKNISIIFTTNFLMLLFGYLHEMNIIDKPTATFYGYVFFLVTFGLIYDQYAQKSAEGKQLFALLFIIWGLYGIAFLLDDIPKNNTINLLDLFAKNFFGIFLTYKALSLSNEG
jgi:bacteriorhodopsin